MSSVVAERCVEKGSSINVPAKDFSVRNSPEFAVGSFSRIFDLRTLVVSHNKNIKFRCDLASSFVILKFGS